MDINTDLINYASSQSKTKATSSDKSSSSIVDKDGYMKLFLASLQYQDPSSPMDTKDMMAQMAQLSMIETITNLGATVDTLKEAVTQNPLDVGVSFIGKHVSGTGSGGTFISGVVDEVVNKNGSLQLIVDGKPIEYGSLTSVANKVYAEKQL